MPRHLPVRFLLSVFWGKWFIDSFIIPSLLQGITAFLIGGIVYSIWNICAVMDLILLLEIDTYALSDSDT